VLYAGVFAGALLGAVLAHSRSALVGMVAAMVLASVISMVTYGGQGRRRASMTLVGMALLIGGSGFYVIDAELLSPEVMARMQDYRDESRIELAEAAVGHILDQLPDAYGLERFVARYGIPPHNTILNAGIYYGLGGLLAAGYFLVLCSAMLLRYVRRRKPARPTSWMTAGLAIGVVGYVWNGMTHNESFVNSGALFYYLVGLFLWSWHFEVVGGLLPEERRSAEALGGPASLTTVTVG